MIYDWDWDNIKNSTDSYEVSGIKIKVFDYIIVED